MSNDNQPVDLAELVRGQGREILRILEMIFGKLPMSARAENSTIYLNFGTRSARFKCEQWGQDSNRAARFVAGALTGLSNLRLGKPLPGHAEILFEELGEAIERADRRITALKTSREMTPVKDYAPISN